MVSDKNETNCKKPNLKCQFCLGFYASSEGAERFHLELMMWSFESDTTRQAQFWLKHFSLCSLGISGHFPLLCLSWFVLNTLIATLYPAGICDMLCPMVWLLILLLFLRFFFWCAVRIVSLDWYSFPRTLPKYSNSNETFSEICFTIVINGWAKKNRREEKINWHS